MTFLACAAAIVAFLFAFYVGSAIVTSLLSVLALLPLIGDLLFLLFSERGDGAAAFAFAVASLAGYFLAVFLIRKICSKSGNPKLAAKISAVFLALAGINFIVGGGKVLFFGGMVAVGIALWIAAGKMPTPEA